VRQRTIATALSAVLVPFAAGGSAALSAVALAAAIKWVSPRQRTILIEVNVIVLVVALVYLIVALTTAAALFGPVQGGS
jgi:type II secretory pathway component PulM